MLEDSNIPVPEEVEVSAPTEGVDHFEEDLATAQARMQELEEALAKALHDCEEQKTLYLRTLADFQNYRRRQQEEMTRSRQLLLEDFVIQLLPILDNFERALSAAEATRDFSALVEGVRLTERQAQMLLERFDVTAIEAVGQPFDPNLHEAVQRIETTDYPDGMVVDEIERGYLMGDRVIRPSRVIVARAPERPTEGIDTTI